MTVYISDILPFVLYVLGSVLLVVLIILAYRLIKTLDKVDRVVDDVELKTRKLNGLFNVIDNTADGLSNISDALVNLITNAIANVFNKKKKKKDEEPKNE